MKITSRKMIFVTGGTGVLGAHLLYKLAQGNRPIRALCRPSSDKQTVYHVFSYYTTSPQKLFDKIEWIEGDILDNASLYEGIKNVEEIYHCAAMVSFDPSHAKEMRYLNRKGTANIVNVAIENNVSKFCHVSSVAALGQAKNGEAIDESSERSKASPHSAYSESKYLSEMEVWRGVAEGLNAVIVNPSIILAPGDWKRSSAKLFTSVWKGHRFKTTGGSGYVDVKDVINIMTSLMEKEIFGERFLLNAECWPYSSLFDHIATTLNRPKPNIKISKTVLKTAQLLVAAKTALLGGSAPITSDMVRSAFKTSNYSNRKIKDTLNTQFTPIEESIREISQYFLKDIKAGLPI